jgi:peptidoglycan/LPS O-acetylase OafA/YrhL
MAQSVQTNEVTSSTLTRIAFVDGFRAIAMLMVVGIHALGYAKLESSTQTLIAFFVQTVAVPSFFLADGFLFCRRQTSEASFHYGQYIIRSAKRLLFPWLILSVFYGLMRAAFEYSGYLQEKVIIGRDMQEVLIAMYSSYIAPQMYFLLSLFFIRTLSFWVRRFIVGSSLPEIFIAFCVYTFSWHSIENVFEPGLDPFVHAFWGFQYYLLGVVLAMSGQVVEKHASVWAGMAFLVLGIVKVLPWSLPSLAQYSYLVGFVLLFMSVAKSESVLTRVGQSTMGIYLFHAPIVLNGTSLLVSNVLDHSSVTYYIVVVVLTFALSFLITRLLGCNSYGQYLVGKV